MKKSRHHLVGSRGEQIAAVYLCRHGYRIVDRNVRIGRHDEIDIVAFDPRDGVYVFCEVKSRSRADADYRPELNLTWRKRASMARAACHYVAAFPDEVGYRLDAICIVEGKVTAHIEGLGQ